MNLMRVSVTTIDSFKWWQADEDSTLADLLERGPRTRAMMAGTALHHALENATEGERERLHADGFTFEFINPAEIALVSIREIKAEKRYQIDDVTVEMVGKVDSISGIVEDHKLTTNVDLERFSDTYQWRFYLDMFDADVFRWHIFEAMQDYDNDTIRIKGVHHLTQHRYPEMADDLIAVLREYVAFIKENAPSFITQYAG